MHRRMRECPICHRKSVAPLEDNRAFPFCSERCKNIDLARWLNEEYRIPTGDSDDRPEEDA